MREHVHWGALMGSWWMTWGRRVEKSPPLQEDRSLIVWAPPLWQCNHCQVCSEPTVLLCTILYRPLRGMLGVFQSQIRLLVWLTARSPWSDNTSEWNRRLRQGPAVTWPSSHKALPFSAVNPLQPITWQRRPCAHYTPQQRSLTRPYQYHI